ncbi:hypothetical protein VTJ49DRAFT_4916 [Mycothermus thermophilus]|uniref:Uncharacterized protein n=1 Tax=Humicola insolens TaxID=85995 RepID=A0ABR3V528_HUMIN
MELAESWMRTHPKDFIYPSMLIQKALQYAYILGKDDLDREHGINMLMTILTQSPIPAPSLLNMDILRRDDPVTKNGPGEPFDIKLVHNLDLDNPIDTIEVPAGRLAGWNALYGLAGDLCLQTSSSHVPVSSGFPAWAATTTCLVFTYPPGPVYSTDTRYLTIMGTWFVRVGGVSVAALNHYSGGQPYCKLQGPGFAIVYIVMGATSSFLGVYGAFKHMSLWTR